MTYEIEYSCVSHIGRIRRQNQDNFVCVDTMQHYTAEGTDGAIRGRVCSRQGVTFAVFDGMGGEECGEMAAYIAAGAMLQNPLASGDLIDCCMDANRKICSYAEAHDISCMGTTAAILRFDEDQIHLCNIGDSKIFVLTEDRFEQISQDHVSIPIGRRKPPLSQHLGIPEDELIIEPYTACGKCRDGDRYLICSDGLTDMVSNARIEEILRSEGDATDALLRESLDSGGKDNTTFILLRIEKKRSSFLKTLFGGTQQ